MGDDDPFAPMPAVGTLGTPIDLDDGEPKLRERLVSLVRREDHLAGKGIECAIKQAADTSCHACALSEHALDSPLSGLCRVGREQEVVCTKLAVLACSK